MDARKVRFYHAQAKKLDLRRKWQSMAVWPLVYRYGELLKMEFEYQHGAYKIDLYIPQIKLAVEVDEPYHESQQEKDEAREKDISEGLGCDFARLKVRDANGVSLFAQVDKLMGEIDSRIELFNPQPWQSQSKKKIGVKMSIRLGYSEANMKALEDAKIPELVSEMIDDVTALGIEVSEELGPIAPSNGELGCSIIFSGITFVVSVRKNELAKILVTQYDDETVEKLSISLDGPKKGRVLYWVIEEMKGRFDVNQIVALLGTYKQILDA